MKFWVILAALLAFPFLASADDINACAITEDWSSGWHVLVGLGLLISLFVVSLSYMVGSLLHNPGLIARAKSDLLQVAVTGVMAASFVFLVTGFCSFNTADIGLSGGGNTFDVAGRYLQWLEDTTYLVYDNLVIAAGLVGTAASFMGGRTWTGIGISAQMFSGASPVLQTINLFMSATLFSIISVVAQKTVLKFIEAGMLNILLPVGIVCRSFPLTREFGGALMAIAIGLFLFYPLMLAIDYMVVGEPTAPPPDTSIVLEGIGLWTSMVAMSVTLFLPGPAAWAALPGLFVSVGLVALSLTGIVTAVYASAGYLLLGAFLLPAINGIVLISVVKDLSKMLGVEVDITTLTRMV